MAVEEKSEKEEKGSQSSSIIENPNDPAQALNGLNFNQLDEEGGEEIEVKPVIKPEASSTEETESSKEGTEGEGSEEGTEELTDEQVQSKLEELEKKEEEDLTEEEIKFIEDNTTTDMEEFYQTIGHEEGINLDDYESSFEGSSQLSRDIVKIRSEKLAAQLYNEKIKEDPARAALDAHLVAGKSLETFLLRHHVEDYSKIDTSTEDGQKQLLSHYYKEKGLEDSIITNIVEKHENDGKLEEVTKGVKKEMDASKSEQIKLQEDKEIASFQIKQADDLKFNNEVKDIVRSGKLGSLNLSSEQSKKFEKQLFTANTEGVQEVEEAYSKLSTEDRLVLDYITLNKDILKGLFGKGKAASIKDKGFKERFNNNKKRNSVTPKERGSSSDFQEIGGMDDLDNLDLKIELSRTHQK